MILSNYRYIVFKFSELKTADKLIGADDVPRLLDFGLGRPVEQCRGLEKNPSRENAIGRPPNMDCRQSSPGEILKQLGLLLFSMVLGDTETDDLEHHRRDGFDRIRISIINEAVSIELDAIYITCVNQNPKNDTCQRLFGEDMNRFVVGERLFATWLQRNWFWNWQ